MMTNSLPDVLILLACLTVWTSSGFVSSAADDKVPQALGQHLNTMSSMTGDIESHVISLDEVLAQRNSRPKGKSAKFFMPRFSISLRFGGGGGYRRMADVGWVLRWWVTGLWMRRRRAAVGIDHLSFNQLA